MTSLLRPLLASVLLLAAGARAEDALPAWLSVPTRACVEGAVTAKCRCGGSRITSGYCCEGTPGASSCVYTLVVTPSGTGSGTVTSSPVGISCGSTCSYGFASGASVTLSAAAAGSDTFTGWAGSGCSGTGTCVVSMTGSLEVAAGFALSGAPEFLFAADSPWNTPTPAGTVWYDTPTLHYGGDGSEANGPRHYWVTTDFGVTWSSPSDPEWTFDLRAVAAADWHRVRPAVTLTVRAPETLSAQPADDRIIVVADPATGDYVEVWMANVDATTHTVTNDVGAVYATGNLYADSGFGDLASNLNAGVRASNFSWAAGIISADDIAAGAINHALVLAMPAYAPNCMIAGGAVAGPFSSPATCGNSYLGCGPIRMGSRIGIPSDQTPPAGLSTIGAMVWDALQTYGAFVGDGNGGAAPAFYADGPALGIPNGVPPDGTIFQPLVAYWYYSGSADMEKIGPYLRVADYDPAGTAQENPPAYDVGAGSYGGTQSVTIDCTTGATGCYTTDGTDPAAATPGTCSAGTTYNNVALSITADTTIRALCTRSGNTNSVIVAASYVIGTVEASPTFDPGAGSYATAQSVTLAAGAGATICYTTDGSDPAASTPGTCSHGTTYSAAVPVASSLTLKAVATKSGSTNSSIASAAYVIGVAGNSDTFTGAQVALATHNAAWGNLTADYAVSGMEIDGSGSARATAAWTNSGARFTTSTADISQVVLVAQGTTTASQIRGPALRSDGTNCYEMRIYGATGGNYTNWAIYRNDAGTATWLNSGTYTGSLSTNHTARFTITGTGTITLHAIVDSTEVGTATDASPLPVGAPGFFQYANGNVNNTLFDNWQDN